MGDTLEGPLQPIVIQAQPLPVPPMPPVSTPDTSIFIAFLLLTLITAINAFACGFIFARVLSRREQQMYSTTPLPDDPKKETLIYQQKDTLDPLTPIVGERGVQATLHAIEQKIKGPKTPQEVTKKIDEAPMPHPTGAVLKYPKPEEIRKQKEEAVEKAYWHDRLAREARGEKKGGSFVV